MVHYWETKAHASLLEEAKKVKSLHLRELLANGTRCERLFVDVPELGIADFSRQKVTLEALENLMALAKECNLKEKIVGMFGGAKINKTENRAVLHTALRAHESDVFVVDGANNVVTQVHEVLSNIAAFSEAIRSGTHRGVSGEKLTDVICVGIGGSYLGPEFVYEAIRTYKPCTKAAEGRKLRFLANVDPIDVARATEGLCPAKTLVVVVSKTFTTAETMLNARTLREWLVEGLGSKNNSTEQIVGHHMVAISTNLTATREFGVQKVFGFWDWVGGRFSVCSAVGCLPLALHFGFDEVRQFLDGCRAMDIHFRDSPWHQNLPVLMGLLGVWNATYLGHESVAVLPYCQALTRFAAHIQQLTMESNGKRVTMDGTPLPAPCGEVFFGEPGTNGQHSFYQLLHQGRIIPADFIGFCRTQNSIMLASEQVSNHGELMSNFFAQPDALALGKTVDQLKAENVPSDLVPHKLFPGDRPSTSLLMPICSPYYVGALLALYEHRTAVQGFLWGLNSFDQWGVELGKVLAKNIRHILAARTAGNPATTLERNLPSSTLNLLAKFYEGQANDSTILGA